MKILMPLPPNLSKLPWIGSGLGLLCVIGWLAIPGQIQADLLESDSYQIQFGNLNITSGEKSSASYNVTDTVGQTGAGPFGEYGSSTWFVGSGFQYIYQIDAFSFEISTTEVDLGTLTSSSLSTGNHTLTISTRGAGGYSVYAYEAHPLRHEDGVTTIPDTICDNGLCDETNAEIWTNSSTSGFGFNIDGDDVPSDFVSTSYFRQFADDSAAENAQVVMNSSHTADQRQATVTYQVGMPGNQQAGTYQTHVVYIAVPGY